MDPRIGADVGVAKQHRIVAGLAGLERDVGVPRVERHTLGDRAVVVEVQSCMQAGAAWRTGRGLRVVPPEQHTLSSESVQIRGLETRVPKRRKTIAPPLICSYEEDVKRLGHRSCGSFVNL
jgi:hypothetical protein